MKYIEDEDKQKLFRIGLKVEQIKRNQKEILDFLIDKKGNARYEGTQEILDILKGYEKGENPDYIGEGVFQSNGEPVIRMLRLFGINTNLTHEDGIFGV